MFEKIDNIEANVDLSFEEDRMKKILYCTEVQFDMFLFAKNHAQIE